MAGFLRLAALKYPTAEIRSGSRVSLCFALEQRRLAFQPPAIAGQRLMTADHAMAGHQQADGVAGAGAGDRTGVAAEGCRQLTVATRLAGGNLLQRLPDALLKGRAAQIERQLGGTLRFRSEEHAPETQSLMRRPYAA